jgi:hypothetical protein
MRQSEIDLFLPNCIIENDYMGQIRESERKNLKKRKDIGKSIVRKFSYFRNEREDYFLSDELKLKVESWKNIKDFTAVSVIKPFNEQFRN